MKTPSKKEDGEKIIYKCERCNKKIKNTELQHVNNEANIIETYHKRCFKAEEQVRLQKSRLEDKQEQENPRIISPVVSPYEKENNNLREEIIMALATKKNAHATELIVQYLLSNNKIYTTRDDEKPEIWIYQEGIYLPNGRTYVRETIRELAGNLFSSHLINDVIRKVETDTYVDPTEFFKRDQEFPHLIAIQNGILNINTRELSKYTPRKFFFSKLPITYNPQNKCPKIIEFIKDITHEKDREVLQEFAGFVLLREYKYERSLMLTGNGRNGKSKFLNLLEHLVGAENVSNISLQAMEKDQFALSELLGKLTNIAGDLSKEALENTGNFKGVVGRDTLQASRKFKTRIQFVNYAKMLFSANELPRTTDMSEAFFDRWILIKFPYKFLPKEEILKLTKEEQTNIKEQKTDIIENITTEQELSGFLNWVLDGYARLRNNNTFSYSLTSKQVQEMWIRKSDSFRAFCMDCLEEDWEGEITKKELRKQYSIYCRHHKVRSVSEKVIKHVLETDFGVSEEQSSYDKRLRMWVGVRFVDEVHVDSVLDKNNNAQKEQGISSLAEFEKTPRSETPCEPCTLFGSEKLQETFKTWMNLGKNKERTILEITAEWQKLDITKLLREGIIFEHKPGRMKTL